MKKLTDKQVENVMSSFKETLDTGLGVEPLNCTHTNTIKLKDRTVSIQIGNKVIHVDGESLRCKDCGKQFFIPDGKIKDLFKTMWDTARLLRTLLYAQNYIGQEYLEKLNTPVGRANMVHNTQTMTNIIEKMVMVVDTIEREEKENKCIKITGDFKDSKNDIQYVKLAKEMLRNKKNTEIPFGNYIEKRKLNDVLKDIEKNQLSGARFLWLADVLDVDVKITV